jgi:hypothetical protein
MCTMIAEQIAVEGSGRAASGWFTLKAAQVSYDHPFHAPDEHALNLDFVDEQHGLGGRVAVELSLASARQLVATIQAVLAEAEARGQL